MTQSSLLRSYLPTVLHWETHFQHMGFAGHTQDTAVSFLAHWSWLNPWGFIHSTYITICMFQHGSLKLNYTAKEKGETQACNCHDLEISGELRLTNISTWTEILADNEVTAPYTGKLSFHISMYLRYPT
jgi:hypothetical protein